MNHRNHSHLLPVILTIIITSLHLKAADPERFAKGINAWTEQDKKTPPPAGLTLFVGSSSIKRWKSLKEDFPKARVLNRGFGGSWTADLLHYMDRIVLPYKPARIVVYCGENDIAHDEAAEVPFENWKIFVERVRKVLPETGLYYIPMKPSLKRWNLWPKYQKGNRLIQDYCRREDITYLANIPRRMLGEDGTPFPGIFDKDKLHLNAEGYKIWVEEIRKAFEADSRKP